jgi:hypothetical protein
MQFQYNDGGRSSAGYKGSTGDCVIRAVTIASGLTYQEVYNALSEGCKSQRLTKRSVKKSSARNGVHVKRKWFKDYMKGIGFTWTPTMFIASGCKVHLTDGELPSGRLIVSVSKHYTSVIDGVIHDTHNPQREAHHLEPYRGQDLKEGQWITKGNVNGSDGLAWISKRCVYGYWKQ